jgi:hypothetical protein
MQSRLNFLLSATAVRAVRYFAMAFALLCFAAMGAGAALAQQPTAAQRDAIKSACRADFIANCSGVTPGGMQALQCLQQHNASLSQPCQKAIGALKGGKSSSAAPDTPAVQPAASPAAASAAAPAKAAPTTAQRNAVKAACRSDFMAQCSGVTPGGTAALSCLQQHSASLSAGCQQAVAAIGGSAPAPGASAPAAAVTPAPAIPMRAFTPREEIFIVRQSCGPDFRSYCGVVPLGGGRGIACLRRNAARLSPACQQVLTSGL